MSDETQIKTAPETHIPPPAPSPFAPEPPGPVPAPAPRKRGAFPTRPSSSAGAGTEENRLNVYQIVTSRILELLERGTVPWRAGWTASGVGEPRSAVTGKALSTVVAPDLTLPTSDGDPFDLSSLRGQKVLLVAWASW